MKACAARAVPACRTLLRPSLKHGLWILLFSRSPRRLNDFAQRADFAFVTGCTTYFYNAYDCTLAGSFPLPSHFERSQQARRRHRLDMRVYCFPHCCCSVTSLLCSCNIGPPPILSPLLASLSSVLLPQAINSSPDAAGDASSPPCTPPRLRSLCSARFARCDTWPQLQSTCSSSPSMAAQEAAALGAHCSMRFAIT
jgi:hypothetical protein